MYECILPMQIMCVHIVYTHIHTYTYIHTYIHTYTPYIMDIIMYGHTYITCILCLAFRATEMVKKFEELDEDGSGKLDVEEAKAGLKSMQVQVYYYTC